MKPFASLQEIHSAIKTVADTDEGDLFWNRILAHKAMPIIFDETVLFFYRGDAKAVEWRGDFSDWTSTEKTQGKRIGNSNIWYMEVSFPRNGRFDYKVVLDGNDWQLDPLNRYEQLGGYGPNSELRMPDWRPSEYVNRRERIARGNFSSDKEFRSARLGYSLVYRVYVPAGFNASKPNDLPVLYVTDGSDYWDDEMGSLVIILDNLIAEKRITPILAIFIDPWDRKAKVNRRESELIPAEDGACKFCEFIVDELIREVEPLYSIRGKERAIVGASYGGLHATFMAMRYGSLFEFFGTQSGAFRPAMWMLDEIGKVEKLPSKAFIHVGTFEPHSIPPNEKLRDVLKKRNVQVQYFEVPEGHSWGHWRAFLDDILIFFYGTAK